MLKRSAKGGGAPFPAANIALRASLLLTRLLPSVHARTVAVFISFALIVLGLSFIAIMREKALITRAHDAYIAGGQLAKYLTQILAEPSLLSRNAPFEIGQTGFVVTYRVNENKSLQGSSRGQWRETPLSLSLDKTGVGGRGTTLALRVLSNGGAFSVAHLANVGKEAGFSSRLASLSQYLARSLHQQQVAIQHGAGWLVISHRRLWNDDTRPARYGWWFICGILGLGLVTPVLLRKIFSPLGAMARDAQARKGREEFEPLGLQGVHETDVIAKSVNHLLKKNANQLEGHTEFMAAISHDLATPVTRLRLRARLIADEGLRDKFIRDCAQMSCMLKDALAYFRNEAIDEEMRLVRINSLVESLCQDYQDAGKNVSFTKAPPLGFDTVPSLFHGERAHQTIDFERSLTALVRPNAVRRAIQNLMDNALKFGGIAEVGLNATSDTLTISINDNGPGIPAHELEQVFKPFYRIDRARNMDTGGSGLGLAIVQAIVEAHGGSITLENNQPGLCAIISLPRGVNPG